jgi:broad-specificity NMP kinase
MDESSWWKSAVMPLESLVLVTTGLLHALDDEELAFVLANQMAQLQSRLSQREYDSILS